VHWLIAAGLHRKANATTVRIAEDLAARMDYTTGHVRYCLDEIVARTGISRATVKRHVSYLRELGALAWVQHGTRANIRRAMGLKGYAATATVYAAVIPPVYDYAMGHTIIGAGYTARIVIDQRGTTKPVDNSPVDNSSSQGLEPPSLTWVKEVGQVEVVGGVTTTAKRQRNKPTPSKSTSKSRRKRATILGATVTAAGMQLGDKLARALRRRVPWVRRASHNELRWVCADMGEQRWTEDQAVRFVVETGFAHRVDFTWHPASPHRLIAAALRADDERRQQLRQYEEDLANSVSWEESTAGKEFAARASLAALFAAAEPEKPRYTDEDKLRARMNWNNWPDVIEHYDEDPDDALDLYGEALVSYAIRQQARRDARLTGV